MSTINLRELLKADFGIDFPISGGTGNSRESPIIIHYQKPNDYVGVEYGILRCLGIGRRIEWKLIQQTLQNLDGRTIEQMKIETKQTIATEIITQIENYYFDITECFGR
jgi:hypothetical protein